MVIYAQFQYVNGKTVKVPCPNCGQQLVATSNGILKCYICYNEFEDVEAMCSCDDSEYISDYLVVGHTIGHKCDFEYETVCRECSHKEKYIDTYSY